MRKTLLFFSVNGEGLVACSCPTALIATQVFWLYMCCPLLFRLTSAFYFSFWLTLRDNVNFFFQNFVHISDVDLSACFAHQGNVIKRKNDGFFFARV